MLLDLGDFKLHLPPRTEMLKDIQKHTECALRNFLTAVKSGEWGSGTFTPRSETTEEANQRANNEWAELNVFQLYEKFKSWAKATYAETLITTKVSLGIALKKYTDGDPKCELPLITKCEGRSRQVLYTIEIEVGDN